jgi:hypothetical protein
MDQFHLNSSLAYRCHAKTVCRPQWMAFRAQTSAFSHLFSLCLPAETASEVDLTRDSLMRVPVLYDQRYLVVDASKGHPALKNRRSSPEIWRRILSPSPTNPDSKQTVCSCERRVLFSTYFAAGHRNSAAVFPSYLTGEANSSFCNCQKSTLSRHT